MKNQYEILKNRHQKEFNQFPLGAAFNKKQFDEMMEKWGLLSTDTDKILRIGSGCYIRKSDKEEFKALINRLDKVVGGLVLIARNKEAAARLSQMLPDEITKEYRAVVEGEPGKGIMKDYV